MMQSQMAANPIYQSGAQGAAEQDGSPGSLLGEIQALEAAVRSATQTVEDHANTLRSILLPEMKQEPSGNTAPEPMRSDYATRINSAMRSLRQIEQRIASLTERTKIT